ncbi:hypothetical protein BJV78DRAFT_1120509 [Lactifluus subvellereus]|nr:hypothetical protein BJV78DRAFT_1120509 [Lactifluus subvellereus]
MSTTLDAQIDVPTSGPILIEGVVQALCQGVIFAQAARYWECPLNDTMRMKSYVLTLVGLSLLQTMLMSYKLWYILIYREHWSTNPLVWADLFLNGLICTVCEISLLRKCWKARKHPLTRKWVTLPLAFLLITIFIANVYLVSAKVRIFVLVNLPGIGYCPRCGLQTWKIDGCPVLDVAITSILMVYLWRSRTGVDNLDKALHHIITVTWGSAALPSALQIIAVSLYNSKSSESRHLVLFFLLLTGKFYTLGILRSLNSRPDLRGRMTSDDIGRRSLSEWQWDGEPENAVARRSSEVKVPFMVLDVAKSVI